MQAKMARQDAFDAADGERRIELYRSSFDEGLMDGEMAFDMLVKLDRDTAISGAHQTFELLVQELESKLPEVYEQESPHILPWRITHALARREGEQLIRFVEELARKWHEPDRVFETFDKLAFHGRADALAAFAATLIESGVDDDIVEEIEDVAIGVELETNGIASTAPSREREAVLDSIALELHEHEGIPHTRAMLFRDVLERCFALGSSKGAKKAAAKRLWPDRPLLQRAIEAACNGVVVPQTYRAVALVDLLPAYLRRLAARDLLGTLDPARALDDLKPAVRNLQEHAERLCPDAVLLRALARWPEAQSDDRRAVSDPQQTARLLDALASRRSDVQAPSDEARP
jgi:hypothetical protein